METISIVNLSWESLAQPFPLSVLTLLFMQAFGKRLINLLVPLLYKGVADDWQGWAFVTNALTLAFAMTIAFCHKSLGGGEAFVLGLVSMFLATGEYEAARNLGLFKR